jgi:hypothetical protein
MMLATRSVPIGTQFRFRSVQYGPLSKSHAKNRPFTSTALLLPTLPKLPCSSSGVNGMRSPFSRYVFDAFWMTQSVPNFFTLRISPPEPRDTPEDVVRVLALRVVDATDVDLVVVHQHAEAIALNSACTMNVPAACRWSAAAAERSRLRASSENTSLTVSVAIATVATRL